MEKEQFGNLINVLRKRQGMSQKELAEKLAVSASAVNKWERGNNLPDLSMVDDLANVLGVTCNDLMNPELTLGRFEEQGVLVKEQPERKYKAKKQLLGKKKRVSVSGKGNGWKIAIAVVIIFLLGLGAGVGGKTFLEMREIQMTTDVDLYPVNARYVEDPNFGKMFEITYVTQREMDMEAIDVHTSGLKNMYFPGKTVDADTKGVHIYYYSNEDDARAWEDTDCGSVFFFPRK